MGVFSRNSEATAAWDGLAAPWRTALGLAWDAYRAGTSADGAVIVDPEGLPVARARDSVFDVSSGGSHRMLAHAAVGAIGELAPTTRHESFTLYTAIEPCALCMGAVLTSSVGKVWFASLDPYAGASHMSVANPHTARLNTVVQGPLDPPFSTFCAALRLELYMRINPNGSLAGTYRALAPEITDVASRLLEDSVLHKAASRQLTVADTFDFVWPYIAP